MTHELDRLIAMYDLGHVNRRQLMAGLLAIGLGARALGASGNAGNAGDSEPEPDTPEPPLFRARTINHVTIRTADLARSKAFYQTLTGLPIRAEDKDSCEFRLEQGFLGLYALGAGTRAGYDHFCLGVEDFDPKRAVATLEAAQPDAHATLESGNEVYLRDPDGARVQLADVTYKR